jgi:hypothetical protein
VIVSDFCARYSLLPCLCLTFGFQSSKYPDYSRTRSSPFINRATLNALQRSQMIPSTPFCTVVSRDYGRVNSGLKALAERVGFEPTCPALNGTSRFRVDPVTTTSVPLPDIPYFSFPRRTRKKLCIRARHSASMIPDTTSTL